MNENCVCGKVSGISTTQYFISIDSEGECKGCGLSNFCSNKTITLDKTSIAADLKKGDKVSLEYQKVIQTSMIIYLLPILFFFLGIFLSKWIMHIQNELLLFLNAMVATGFALILIHYINNHFGEEKFKVSVKSIN